MTDLEDILAAQFAVYQLLLALTAQERQAILAGDIQALEEIVAQKEAQVAVLAALEARRTETVNAWAGQLGVPAASGRQPGSPLALTDLLPYLDAATAARLRCLRQDILASVADLQRQSQGVRLLVETALARANAVRAFLIGLAGEQPGYTAAGRRAQVAVDGLMLDRNL
jgi:flagellar biosynthesis/type III secretory pathway chaperone